MGIGRQKYPGLPDLDDSAPELYETPDLTDDASIGQTTTQRTTSPAPSDEPDIGFHDPDDGLDRQRIDRDEARRRFEPYQVDARDVDFSDSVAGGRRSYRTSTRRMRRKRDGTEELGDLTDSEDESLGRKLARLKKEAEEVKAELQRREREKGEDQKEQDEEGLDDGVEALTQMLSELSPPRRDGETSAEAALLKRLVSDDVAQNRSPETISQSLAPPGPNHTSPQPSTMTSLANLSDRLTALELTLGLSTVTPSSSAPILPTLASLSSQITTLSTSLSASPTTGPTKSSTFSLDQLTERVRHLISQTDRLTLSRKAAAQAALDLRQARIRAATSPSSAAPQPLRASPPSSSQYLHPHQALRRPTASTTDGPQAPAQPPPQLQTETLQELLSNFDQTAKIDALHATLPRIQELSPLVPLVLERLRSLQFIHAGAAGVKGDLEAVERTQAELASGLKE